MTATEKRHPIGCNSTFQHERGAVFETAGFAGLTQGTAFCQHEDVGAAARWMRGENQTPVEVALGYFGGVGFLLLGICFWSDALGAAVGADRRAGRRGRSSPCGSKRSVPPSWLPAVKTIDMKDADHAGVTSTGRRSMRSTTSN